MARSAAPARHHVVMHIEARLFPLADRTHISEAIISQWIYENYQSLSTHQEISQFDPTGGLADKIERISVAEVTGVLACLGETTFLLEDVQLDIHVFQLQPEHARSVCFQSGPEEESPMSRIVELPSTSFDGLWESLVFEPDIKDKLLHFVSTLFLFATKNVSFVCMSFNRLILLHGPPGSGKTSLSRALAQKISIRLSKHFARHRLIEVNSHNLFSKYFSESGKLVGKLFDEILDMLADPELFVVVLIDEVETLISARKASANGNEPTDSLRVVNAVLTALDKLRTKNNVLVLTTSNLIQAMDPAFLDRADIKQFVDSPQVPAVYTIFRNCLNELIRAGIIQETELIPCSTEAMLSVFSSPEAQSTRLLKCARRCVGFSGRTLGKLPVMMHAGYIQRNECNLDEALEALDKAVDDELDSRSKMESETLVEKPSQMSGTMLMEERVVV